MLHPLPLPLSSCLGCIPPLIGLPSLRFYAVGSSLFLLSVCFCLCSLFYRDDVLCWLLLARPFLYAFHAHLRFPVDLVWFRLSCDHGWIRSGSVNVRKQQQQQQQQPYCCCCCCLHIKSRSDLYSVLSNIRTGPTDANAFRGHRLTTQKGYTYRKEIKGPRKVNTHAIIGKENNPPQKNKAPDSQTSQRHDKGDR